MKKLLIYRICAIALIPLLVVVIWLGIANSLVPRIENGGTCYTNSSGRLSFCVDDGCDSVSVSGDYLVFLEDPEESPDGYNYEFEPIFNLTNATYGSSDEKTYYLRVPEGGECQIYVRDGRSIRAVTVVNRTRLDKVFENGAWLYSQTDFREIKANGSYLDGDMVSDAVVLDFGETYTLSASGVEGNVLNGALDGHESIYFETYNVKGARTYNELTLDKNGNISVAGTEGGYFKVYTDRAGGIVVPYTVAYEESPIIKLVIDSYREMTGITIPATSVTSDIIASLTSLKCDYIPDFLNETIFESFFPSVRTLTVELSEDVSGDRRYYLPSTLKHLEIIGNKQGGVNIRASFYGDGDAEIMLSRVNILGNGTDPTFTGFNSLTLNSGKEGGSSATVRISSRNASALSTDALNVFDGIGTLNLVVKCAPLEIVAGNGGDGYKSYTSTVKEFSTDSSGNYITTTEAITYGLPGDGGNAIICDILNIQADKALTVTGGNGGVGYRGKDGKDGDYFYEGGYLVERRHNGEDGENGGDGGYGIKADRVKLTGSATVTVTGGNGGNGGKGGDGGDGASKSQISLKEQVLYGNGRGGDGGRGGNGGDGNYALYISESLECYTTLKVNTSKGGKYGGKGKGGKGGGDGAFADDGAAGATGGKSGKGYSYLVTSGVVKGEDMIEIIPSVFADIFDILQGESD